MIFSENVVTRVEDFDNYGVMRLSALLEIFENIGNHHSETVNDSAIENSINGMAWILTEWYVQIDKMPEFRNNLCADTWISAKFSGVRSDRNFILKKSDGEIMVRAVARLSILDLKSNKIVRIPENHLQMYKAEENGVFDFRLPKVHPFDAPSEEKTLAVRRSDIDFNGHVHNTVYPEYAEEVLEEELFKNKNVQTLQIVYRLPLRYGDCAVVSRSDQENGFGIKISSQEETCCLIRISLRS